MAQLRERLRTLPREEFGNSANDLEKLLSAAAAAEARQESLADFALTLRRNFNTTRETEPAEADAAQLITAHKAKGSEWDTVIVPFLAREARLGGVGAVVAVEIEKRTGKETRVCVLGHLQRGGGPTTFDRLLCTRFGARAVQLVADGMFGYMVALRPPDTVAVKITDAIGRLRAVPLNGDIMQTARALGISFGD